MEKVEKALSELLTKPDASNSGFWQTVVDTMSEALIVVGTDRRILYFKGGRGLDRVEPRPGPG